MNLCLVGQSKRHGKNEKKRSNNQHPEDWKMQKPKTKNQTIKQTITLQSASCLKKRKQMKKGIQKHRKQHQ